jgi:hypothetical protein
MATVNCCSSIRLTELAQSALEMSVAYLGNEEDDDLFGEREGNDLQYQRSHHLTSLLRNPSLISGSLLPSTHEVSA